MKEPNLYGVYEPEAIHETARFGRAYVQVKTALCRDGRYRYAVDMHYSYGGRCEPITDHGEGFAGAIEAQDAAMAKMLADFPLGRGDPTGARAELQELRRQVEAAFRQPSLF